jgi:hypothetical protein
MINVSIKGKNLKTEKCFGFIIGVSDKLIARGAVIDSSLLIALVLEYLYKVNIPEVGELYVQCKRDGMETEEIRLDKGFVKDLVLIEKVGKEKEEEKKPDVKKDFPHVPDAKGFCKHCFKHISKKNAGMYCREAQQDYKDEHASDKRKQNIEQESEGHAFTNFKRS